MFHVDLQPTRSSQYRESRKIHQSRRKWVWIRNWMRKLCSAPLKNQWTQLTTSFCFVFFTLLKTLSWKCVFFWRNENYLKNHHVMKVHLWILKFYSIFHGNLPICKKLFTSFFSSQFPIQKNIQEEIISSTYIEFTSVRWTLLFLFLHDSAM